MLSPAFLAQYTDRQPDWGFNGLGYVVYKRSYARRVEGAGRTEEWRETLARVVEGAQAIGAGLTSREEARLFALMFELKGLPGGRMLWQLGTPNVARLGGDSLVNCWWTELRGADDFAFIMTELMLGGGVGFSVRRTDVGGLPPVRVAGRHGGLAQHVPTRDADFIVPDKREGWTEVLRRTLDAYLVTGQSFTYSTVLVRGAGEPISTFGGTAAGPGILVEGLEKIQRVLAARAGRKLRSVDVLDIANLIGSVVVAGNVRRSAQIAIGDPDDLAYLRAKRWDSGSIPAWRAMSNNSVEVTHPDDVPEEFWEGYTGNGEPYGLVNLEAARHCGRTGEVRPDPLISGVNPCAEILLEHHEPCNLAEVFLPRVSSLEEMQEIAGLLYKVQKAVTSLKYTDPLAERTVHANRRLGLGVGGVAQASEEQLSWLAPTYDYLRQLDAEWSEVLGVPESVRLTTVKPSGTLSLLAGVTPGAHPGYSKFHVRRVRMAADDVLVEYCRDRGFPVEYVRQLDGSQDHRTVVVEFPARFPTGTWTANGAAEPLRQLELLRRLQAEWADNAVSATVYYAREDLPLIRAWLAEHWGEIKTVSFLLKDDHGFSQAPLEAITQEEYARRVAAVREITPANGDTFTRLDDLGDECADGACPIR